MITYCRPHIALHIVTTLHCKLSSPHCIASCCYHIALHFQIVVTTLLCNVMTTYCIANSQHHIALQIVITTLYCLLSLPHCIAFSICCNHIAFQIAITSLLCNFLWLRSSLIRVHNVCYSQKLSEMHLNTVYAGDIFRKKVIGRNYM